MLVLFIRVVANLLALLAAGLVVFFPALRLVLNAAAFEVSLRR